MSCHFSRAPRMGGVAHWETRNNTGDICNAKTEERGAFSTMWNNSLGKGGNEFRGIEFPWKDVGNRPESEKDCGETLSGGGLNHIGEK